MTGMDKLWLRFEREQTRPPTTVIRPSATFCCDPGWSKSRLGILPVMQDLFILAAIVALLGSNPIDEEADDILDDI
jgi:hypothetical protein